MLSQCSGESEQQEIFDQEGFSDAMFPIWHAWQHYESSHPHMTMSMNDYLDANTWAFEEMTRLPAPFRHEDFLVSFASDDRDALKSALAEIVNRHDGALAVAHGNMYPVYLPGPAFDRWLNIIPPVTFLEITVQKIDPLGQKLSRPVVGFNFHRYQDGQLLNSFSQTKGPSECIRCHMIGVRTLGKMMTQDQIEMAMQTIGSNRSVLSTIASMNRAATHNVRFRGRVDVALPAIGPVNPEKRSLDFVRHCATQEGLSTTNERLQIIRSAMNCQNCHHVSGSVTAVIPFPRDSWETVAHMVRVGDMPPGAADRLSVDERHVLEHCLELEYYGGIEDRSSSPGLFLTELCDGNQPCIDGTTFGELPVRPSLESESFAGNCLWSPEI